MTKIPDDRPKDAPTREIVDLDALTQADAAALDGWRDSLRAPLPPDEPPARLARVRRQVPVPAFFGRRPAGQGTRFRPGRRQP